MLHAGICAGGGPNREARAVPTATHKVAQVQRANRPLYRAYLLKESLAGILGRRQLHVARTKLHEWIAWATRLRLPAFKKLAKTIPRHLDGILGHIATGLSNGPVEGLNGTPFKVITPASDY